VKNWFQAFAFKCNLYRYTMFAEHFVQVVVRVSRGAAAADRSIAAAATAAAGPAATAGAGAAAGGVGPLWHCELCDAARWGCTS
jgi:hypothetical protein